MTRFLTFAFGNRPKTDKIQNYINAKKMDIKGTGRSGED